MFSQLFGKYLVDNKVITKEQLDEVISKMENVREKLGFIAVSEGILTKERLRRLIFSRHKRMLSSVI